MKNQFQADSILIQSIVLQEEPYFPQMRGPRIVIENPTTSFIDFKKLDTDNPARIVNYEEVEKMLRGVGMEVALQVNENCETQGFNDIIIEFRNIREDGVPLLRFINHYEIVKK